MSVSPKLILPMQSTTALKTMNIYALLDPYPLSIIIDATKIYPLKSSKSGDMTRMDGHFAPCGILCRPNGYEKKHHRLSFCCFKQCKKLKATPLKNLMERYDIAQCPHIENSNGFATHKSIDENPRLHNEIPRGSKRYNEVKKSRSASERSNSTLKEDLKILEKPRILNQETCGYIRPKLHPLFCFSPERSGLWFASPHSCASQSTFEIKNSSFLKFPKTS